MPVRESPKNSIVVPEKDSVNRPPVMHSKKEWL